MLNLYLGGSGTGKSYALIEQIKISLSCNKNIFIIVPDQFSFEFDKKLYYALGASNYNKITVMSFERMAELIFKKYGGKSGAYATELHKNIIMFESISKLLKENRFSFYAKQASKSDFTELALKLITQLRRNNIAPEELLPYSLQPDKSQLYSKMADISAIYSEYDNNLKKHNLKDSLNNISEASAIANKNAFFKNSTVFIDEFESFTADEFQLLDSAMSYADDMYITLRMGTGDDNCGVFETSLKTKNTLVNMALGYNKKINAVLMGKPKRYKSFALEHLSLNIFRTNRSISAYSDGIKCIECRDLYKECDYVCAEIRQLVSEYGYKYSEIAIVSRQLTEYVSILEASAERYRIPIFMDTKKSAGHTSIMIFVTSLLECISAKKFRTETILRYAKTQLLGINYELISLLENYCFQWNVEGDMWLSEFPENDDAEQTRCKIIEPLVNLRKKCIKKLTARSVTEALYDTFEEIGIPVNISGLSQYYKDNGFIYIARELKLLWKKLIDMLDTIYDTLGDSPITISGYRELLMSMLKGNKYSVPPQKLNTVIAAQAETARLDSPKITFILGVNEGLFPFSPKTSGLLSEHDKQLLADDGLEFSLSLSETLSAEQMIVYKMMTSPSEKLYISYPLADSQGNARFPSFIAKQTESMFSDTIKLFAENLNLLFYCSTPEAAYYNYVRNIKNPSPQLSAIRKALCRYPQYEQKMNVLDSICENTDFKLKNPDITKLLFGNPLSVSATSFEEYQKCPFGFFCKYGLKLRVLRKNEFGNLEFGNFIHGCLEKIFTSCKTKDDFDNLSDGDINSHINKYAAYYKENQLGGDYGKTARFNYLFSHLVESTFYLIKHLQKELSQSSFRPANSELLISEKSSAGPIKLITPEGIEIVLSGKVDRVDIFKDEQSGEKFIRIIDYKTGNKSISFKNLLYGIDMQMFLYIFSLTEKEGLYNDSISAGILYMPSGLPECSGSRNDTVSIEKLLDKNYKMKGLVLGERSVLSAMEKDIQGIYIPVNLLKSDTGSGEPVLSKESLKCTVSRTQFENMRKFCKDFISHTASLLYNGKISAKPFIPDGNTKLSPCNYCDFSAICGHFNSLGYRSYSDDAESAMFEILNGKNPNLEKIMSDSEKYSNDNLTEMEDNSDE